MTSQINDNPTTSGKLLNQDSAIGLTLKMPTTTNDIPESSSGNCVLDEVTKLSSLMERLTKRVDNLENEKQHLNVEISGLTSWTTKLVEQSVKKLEDKCVKLEEKCVKLEEKCVKLEEKFVELDDKSVELDDNPVQLEKSNIQLIQEVKNLKESIESIESKLVYRGDEMIRLSSKMDRLTNKIDNLENANQRLNVDNADLKTTTIKLETMNKVLVHDLKKTKESIESKLVVGEATNATSQVGFTAVLTRDVTLGPLQTIVYEKVITNIGKWFFKVHKRDILDMDSNYLLSCSLQKRTLSLNIKIVESIRKGYDSHHGHFIAPVSGLYIISATTHSCSNLHIWSEIVRNGERLASMFGQTYDFASHTVVVSLKQNDQIWVRNHGQLTKAHAWEDRNYCSFSGVLIAAS
ncbi:unnamed protein product [Mytilus coruscus]|uniref:C1q domain-containing protein n=1 Tax=Mytilus coruscus TaxID=42192 RepID=A0A6J8E947_MYTCO|nr:unnamed protein product [Mytilus coruscus]